MVISDTTNILSRLYIVILLTDEIYYITYTIYDDILDFFIFLSVIITLRWVKMFGFRKSKTNHFQTEFDLSIRNSNKNKSVKLKSVDFSKSSTTIHVQSVYIFNIQESYSWNFCKYIMFNKESP